MTHLDIYENMFHLVEKSLGQQCHSNRLEQVRELGLLIVRMSMQNVEYCKHQKTEVVLASIICACGMLQQDTATNSIKKTVWDQNKHVFEK